MPWQWVRNDGLDAENGFVIPPRNDVKIGWLQRSILKMGIINPAIWFYHGLTFLLF
ncbi:MAG: hypothetical protein ICV53_11315 [Flavisolibacter sp.]|nr:hypothetical protein [Flavisolibacter sp.]